MHIGFNMYLKLDELNTSSYITNSNPYEGNSMPILGVQQSSSFHANSPENEFVQKLENVLTKNGCKLQKPLSPELTNYLYALMNRKGNASSLAPGCASEYKDLLSHIGDNLKGLIKEFDKAKTSGKGFDGFVEILALSAHYQSIAKEVADPLGHYMESEFLSSSLADREPPLGTILSLPGREPKDWVVDFSEEHGGAFVYVLKPLYSDTNDAIVVCRGTAGRKTASGALNSLVNDVIPQIGMKGVTDSWGHIRNYLSNNSISQVEVEGKSMGGAVAQELSVLIAGTTSTKVKQLTTLQSTGVHDEVHEAYDKLDSPFPINAFRHAQMEGLANDLVPKVGGYHLGKGRENYNLYDVNLSETVVQAKTGKRLNILGLIKGLGETHVRQLRFTPNQLKVHRRVTGNLQKKEKSGSKRFLEWYRSIIGPIFKLFVPHKTFEELYKQEKKKFK